MKTGNAHKMGVRRVDKDKTGPGKVTGPGGGGKISGINLRRKAVELCYGSDKPLHRFVGPPAKGTEEKTGASDPEGHKVKINGDPPWTKRYFAVQRVIHLANRNPPRQNRRLILKEKKIVKNRFNALRPNTSEGRDA
jgi:hypothetical protein